jgi:hypothetical protein
MPFQASRRTYTYDANMLFKDAGLIAASAAAQVSGSNRIITVGDTFIKAVMQIDVTAVEIGTGNEKFGLLVQGSTSATFASVIETLAALDLGAASSGRWGSAQDSVVGRYELPFMNVQAGVQYPYLRMYTFVSGTIATGINYSAWAGLDC